MGQQTHWPPLADEDWHATCQAIFKRVEGAERETMYHKDKLHQADNLKKSGALWGVKEGRDKGTGTYDLGSVQQIETSAQVRLGL